MSRRPALTFIIILGIGIVLGIGVKSLFFTDQDTQPEETVSEEKPSRKAILDDADVSAEDIELVQGKQGAMTWKLLAISAKYNQEKGLIGVERPQLTAYFGDDRKEVYVRSDTGEVDQKNDNLTLYKNVTGRFGNMAIDSQQLDYIGALDKVFLKGGVTLRRPDMTIKAKALEINLESRQMVASGGVEALLAPKGLENNPLYDDKE